MPEKISKSDLKRDEGGVELETQFIIRVPEEPAQILREAIQSGANNLKDRLKIKLDDDLRKGVLLLDNYYLYAKVVDLPCIIESLKTIDFKSFYKSADICQMMICKDEPDPITEDESPVKNKKKDSNKVDKKFLWPHGITPPCKNVRKRRFRKTLKKKNDEKPEIEKEVKRLLRVDNEAVNVKWEIVDEDVDQEKEHGQDLPKGKKGQQKPKFNKPVVKDQLDQHDIFGEEVSDSDEDDANNINVMDMDSRLSYDSHSRFSDSNSHQDMGASTSGMATEFNRTMFDQAGPSSQGMDDYDDTKDMTANESLTSQLTELERELSELKNQQNKIEQEIHTIDNKKLKERLQEDLDNIMGNIISKEMEIDDLVTQDG
ncbi:unnamed protein product [Diamesa hyperborea]